MKANANDRAAQGAFLRFRDDGDLAAIGEVFDRLGPELLAVAQRVSADRSEAEDLVQATFLVAMRAPQSFDGKRPVGAWLVGILTKQAMSWQRRAARFPDVQRLSEPRLDREFADRPDRKLESSETQGLIQEALSRLPEAYGELLRRRLCGGQPAAQIAVECGLPAATVRVRLHRGLALLRGLLPAGLAGTLVLGLPERGLAAVREELMEWGTSEGVPALSVPGPIQAVGGLSLVQWVAGSLLLVLLGALGVGIWSGEFGFSEAGYGTQLLEPGPTVSDPQASVPLEGQGESSPARLAGTKTSGANNIEAAPKRRKVAAVWVRTFWSDGSVARGVAFQYQANSPYTELQVARTDDRGECLLDDLQPGYLAVYPDRGGHASRHVPGLKLLESQIAEGLHKDLASELKITLEKGVDVRGHVLDHEGRAVAHAELWVTTGMNRNQGLVLAHSEPDGSFFLRGCSSACFIGARLQGYAPSDAQGVQYHLERHPEGEELQVDLVLPGTSARLRGQVLDSTGRPLSGALVRVGAPGPFDSYGPSGVESPAPPVQIESDEGGLFACDMLPTGDVLVACRVPGFADWVCLLPSPSLDSSPVEIRLEAGAWVHGQLRREDGQPPSNLRVLAYQDSLQAPNPESPFGYPHALTDDRGAFQIGPLAPGQTKVYAQTTDGLRVSRNFDLAPGQVMPWEDVLRGQEKITGIARGLDGEALAGWTVASEPLASGDPPSRAVHTRADGSFEILFPSRGNCRLELFRPALASRAERGWVAASAPLSWIESVATGTQDLSFGIQPEQVPRGALQGELQFPFGRSVPKISISGYHPKFSTVFEEELELQSTRFAFSELPAGALSVRIQAPGYQELWKRDIRLGPGQRVDLGVLKLKPLNPK